MLTHNMCTRQHDIMLTLEQKEVFTMAKLIKAVRIREDRAEALRDKAIALMIKRKEVIREADIINFLIDEYTEKVDADDLGFKIN